MATEVELETGVYAIRNRRNGKVYVGSAGRSFKGRWSEHRHALIGKRHFNRHLQTAWDKYGGDAFEFVILERCPIAECVAREQHWIDWYKASDRRYGYNNRPVAGSNRGKKFGPHTAENNARRSASLKEAWRKAPHLPLSAEAREKIGRAFRGRKQSVEHVAQKTKTRVESGYKHNAETRAKIGAGNAIALKGRKMPDEVKKKIAEATLAFHARRREAENGE